MNAKIVRFKLEDGTIVKETEEQVIFTLGEFPEEMPEVNITVPYGDSEEEALSISLNVEELQKLISADETLKWIKKKNSIEWKG